MIKIFFLGIILCLSAVKGCAWTNGQLLIWISDNRAYHALVDLGKAFEREVGATVKVKLRNKSTRNFKLPPKAEKGLTYSSGPTIALGNGRMVD